MRKFIFLISIVIIFTCNSFSQDEQLVWPREIDTKEGIVTIYQPQLESFINDTLEGRMAISIKPAEGEMLFCAAWFKARLTTDLDDRTAALETMEIPRIHFPDIEDESKIDQLKAFLKKEFESWNVVMSLDRLIASMDDVEDLKNQSVPLSNDPPDIYFRTSPTTLVSIDGDPILKKIDDSSLEYVVNTPFFIVKEQNKKSTYLKGGKFWYMSDEIFAGWEATEKVPSDIEKLAKDNIQEGEPDSISASITAPPELIVVSKPAELIITDGEPDYATIEGTSLLYAKNSESDIIMDINTQDHYILLAGRWYHSKSLKDGDWQFCEPANLPADFSKIPEDSDMATVRASIPGTPEAQDALLEQNIPQTATVDRKTAKVEVTYDGNPEFKKVEGTDVAYAANTDKTVLRIKDKYYCVDDGIWFVADNANGPWAVSDVRPDEVDDLPPSSEVYNVKYVYIYDSTPDPWYRYYYYPRPVTWGFGVHWNPRTGWGFSFGFSYGWVGWRFHPYRGWWGPRGYRHGYRHGYNRGYRHGARAGYRAGYRAGQRNASRNVYRNRSTGVKHSAIAKRGPTTSNISNRTRASTKQNNMYTDKKGNVYQKNQSGSWDQKSNKKTSQGVSQRASTSQKSTSVNKSQNKQLDRSAQSRSRGNTNYNRSRSSSPSRSSGRSGGGRRR
jgi:hypothetical protein